MLYFVHDAFHQCRFTFTVFADKCHLITAFYCQSGVAEDNTKDGCSEGICKLISRQYFLNQNVYL